jgi:uncharacterized protein YecE (DUF72 family)
MTRAASGLRVGTSGWQYADWRPDVYPEGLGQSKWLARYAELFDTVELNNSFYRLPTEESFRRWATTTPPEFCFAVKASRYLTHMKRLIMPKQPVKLLLERARLLGPKLGPVLLQLPPRFKCEPGRLDATLEAFGPDVRVAVEVRDERWHHDAVYEVLAKHRAALCWWDRRGARGPLVKTTDWIYLRMHEGRARTAPSYGRRALESWVERVVDAYGADVAGWVYFNNDPGAAAPRDAAAFRRLAGRAGVAVSAPRAPARPRSSRPVSHGP